MSSKIIKDKLVNEWCSLIATGDLSGIKAGLKNGNLSCKDCLNKSKLTPLHLAAWYQKPAVCQLLLDEGAKINSQETFSQKTPLHIAAYTGNLDTLKLLSEAGAENKYDILGCYPIHYAALGEHEDSICYLLESSCTSNLSSKSKAIGIEKCSALGNVLDILIRKGNNGLVEQFFAGADIISVDNNPRLKSMFYIGYMNEYIWTPFHSAAIMGNAEVTQMFLKRFANAQCINEEFIGETCREHIDYFPREIAMHAGHKDVAMLYDPSLKRRYQSFSNFSVNKKSGPYAKDLLDAICNRSFDSLKHLLNEHGEEILYEKVFNDENHHPINGLHGMYNDMKKLNAFSVIARTFCIEIADFFEENAIPINADEFVLNRDVKELIFFNWAMMDINPYATKFFDDLHCIPLEKAA